MSDFAFTIDVPVRTEWRNVNLLVTSVQNCFNAMFANVDGSQMIAMVTGELLENAIKYGVWASADRVFRLHVIGRADLAKVIVENPADDRSAAAMMERLGWLRSFEQPSDAYRAKLLELAGKDPSEGAGGLGLVRIAYEAGCTIGATYEAGILRVEAELRV